MINSERCQVKTIKLSICINSSQKGGAEIKLETVKVSSEYSWFR